MGRTFRGKTSASIAVFGTYLALDCARGDYAP
ncbi:MAG: hypothetical protein QOJ64_4007 [Acidobacteriota bacterium]|jgi:hypothetical protein|nr:hypothetical protein [Acidobacteriota bacterium]